MIDKTRIVQTMHLVEDTIKVQEQEGEDADVVLYEVLATLRLILDDREKMFVDSAEGGSGRDSIKKSHRAEGRNFID